MAKFGIAPGPSRARRKVATAFAAAGALLLSSGMVVMAAAPAQADNITPICHATGSDTNPYLYKEIDQSSTDPEGQGHGAHFSDPQMSWGNQGVWWNGQWYAPGTDKPDIVGDQVTRAYCEALGTKGPLATTPGVTFVDPTCDSALSIRYANDETVVYVLSGDEVPGGSVTVTATPVAGYEFARNATTSWTHTFSQPEGCDVVLVPVSVDPEPSPSPNTCSVDGTLNLPAGTGYTWTGADDGAGPGTYQVTAVAVDGYELTGQTTWTIVVPEAGAGLDCPNDDADLVEATPLAPTFVEAGCATDPRIEYPTVTGVRYGRAGDVIPGGTVTVTAVALKDFVLKAGETSTWSHTFSAKPTGTACGEGGGPVVVPTPDVDELVSPRYASATGASCSRDGQLVVPTQPAGVLVQQTGAAPGDVTFTYAPADGYAFPAGADTEVTVNVPAQLTGDDCIKGVETSRPQPTPGTANPGNDGPAVAPVKGGTDAEVLGEQAVAVPTAVAAGLGDTMTATSTGSPQLAQALVAAGLLMLVMGGATGLGRRTRGAHES